MTDFRLGQRVRFTRPLERVNTWDPEQRGHGKEWHYPAHAKNVEQEGVLIGKRTLVNGRIHWDDGGTVFVPVEYFPAYLIVTAMHLKPVHVRVEDVKPARLHWTVPPEGMFYTPEDIRQVAGEAWLQGAAAGASVDMGFIPSDALHRSLPPWLADQFHDLNPYSTPED